MCRSSSRRTRSPPTTSTQLQQVRADLGLDENVPLLPVDARDRDSVKAVLLGLLYEILESMGK